MATAYLYKTLGTPTSTKKYTFSTWVKRAMESTEEVLISAGTGSSNGDFLVFRSSDQLEWQMYHGSNTGILKTNRLFRDPAAWYHIVITYDSANATAGDRMKMYVNGVEETSFETDTNPPQDTVSYINSAVQNNIGYDTYGLATSAYFGGVLAHTHLCDGQAYAASDFGETDSTSGIWVAKTSPSVTYGNNGFFLKYQDTSAFGDDSSGNNNDFTMSGTITQTKDTPDDNFCIMNPLSAGVINGAGMPLTNGNTTIYDGDANWRSGFGTIGDNQGKYYFEAKMVGSSTNWWVGFLDARQVVKGEYKFVSKTRGYGVAGGGQRGNNNSEVSWGVTYAQNDIAMCALDLDNGKIYFGKNGTWSESGDPTSGSTGTGAAYSVTTDCIYLPAVSLYDTTAGMSLNFGNGYFGTTAVASAGTNASGIGTFEYDVPTGYTAVSTLGLME
tara:strand:- start:1099 stop:2427 length:1329 start_codon:yes stop_codon:yes gene_type:complete